MGLLFCMVIYKGYNRLVPSAGFNVFSTYRFVPHTGDISPICLDIMFDVREGAVVFL